MNAKTNRTFFHEILHFGKARLRKALGDGRLGATAASPDGLRVRAWLIISGALLALAQGTPAQVQNYGLYLRVDGGANFVTGTKVDIGGSPGNLSVDTGYRIDGAFGYEFGRWLAAEFEGGYIDNEVSSIGFQNMTGHPQGDSALTQIPLLVNVVGRYENHTEFEPYIGAGIGAVLSRLNISGEKDSAAVFAWQAKAGVIWRIEHEAWLDIGYKLLMTQKQEYMFGGVPMQTKELFNHFLGVSVTWRF